MISNYKMPVNIENKKLYNKNYYDKNREAILCHLRTTVFCDACQKPMKLYYRSNHNKTRVHQRMSILLEKNKNKNHQ